MSHKAKIMPNVKKYINESKSGNTNKDYTVNQIKLYQCALVSITLVDFDTSLKIFDRRIFAASKIYYGTTI